MASNDIRCYSENQRFTYFSSVLFSLHGMALHVVFDQLPEKFKAGRASV